MTIIGKQFIDGERITSSTETFHSCAAATGEALPERFYQASEADIQAAVIAAAAAYPGYRQRSLHERAAFLDTIAQEIDALDVHFLQAVMCETGLPELRIRSERSRTTGQLRLFASVVRQGDFLGARIDTALPDRQPLPRPDLRQYRIGIGPVAVFGAGNFPLAFSVAGGDTASALAAGCPVLVKAHPGHPLTSELVAQAIVRAVEKCRMPAAVFGMLFGDLIGAKLVKLPQLKAVGFTGSRAGGRALFELAAARPEPIPVFAEMSSVNPVIMLPGALAERSAGIAADLADSVNLGAGQFCTNPGLVIGIKGEAFDLFSRQFAAAMSGREPAVMLSRGILGNYQEGLQRLRNTPGVECLIDGSSQENRAQSALFKASAELLGNPKKPLEEEVFGPCTVLLELDELSQLIELAPQLSGHLTATLLAAGSDLEECRELISVLEARVGRLILNGYPTGVEVCDAMVHGGPWPATSDSRSTSVGSMAIERFLRPVCYQNYPDQLLPAALQSGNPLGLRRLVNGRWSEGGLPAS